MKVCALIPSYNPDERLISTVEDLRAVGFHHIIVVDDGSRVDCQPYFEELAPMDCEVVHLPHNSGKGEALKIGFLTFLTQGWTDAAVSYTHLTALASALHQRAMYPQKTDVRLHIPSSQ